MEGESDLEICRSLQGIHSTSHYDPDRNKRMHLRDGLHDIRDTAGMTPPTDYRGGALKIAVLPPQRVELVRDGQDRLQHVDREVLQEEQGVHPDGNQAGEQHDR